MENKLDKNKLDELGSAVDTEPEAPIHKDKSEEDGFKEMLTLKFRDGSEITLGSSSVNIQRLCELSHILKLNLLNDVNKKIPNYFG